MPVIPIPILLLLKINPIWYFGRAGIWSVLLNRVRSLALAMSILSVGLVTFEIGNVANAEVMMAFEKPRITVAQWLAYRAEIMALPGAQCTADASLQLICDSAVMRTIWVFTAVGHRAYPAVVARRLATKEGEMGIDRQGYFADDPAAFDTWYKTIAALDRRQARQWARPPQR